MSPRSGYFKSSIDDLERTKRDLIEELEKRKIHNIYGNSKLTQVEGQKYAKLEIKFEVLHRQIMEMRGMMLKHDIDLLYDFKNSDKPE